MPITINTKFIGIEDNLVDLVEKKSTLLNKQTDAYTLAEITGAFRKTASSTLLQANWTLVSGVYEQTLSNTDIQATSYVVVIPDNADVPIVQAAEILPQNESIAGGVKVFSENIPIADIAVTLIIFI
jgi:hypothetical protein